MLFYEKYSNLNMNMQVCEVKYKLGVATRHMVISVFFQLSITGQIMPK